MRLNRSALLVASLAKAEIDPDFFRDVQRSSDMAPAIERPFNFQVKMHRFYDKILSEKFTLFYKDKLNVLATLESLSRSTGESGDDRSEFDIDRMVLEINDYLQAASKNRTAMIVVIVHSV